MSAPPGWRGDSVQTIISEIKRAVWTERKSAPKGAFL